MAGERLKQVGLRFRALYHKLDGTPFYGQMGDIPDTSRVSNFLSTRRYLRTMPITNVVFGDVLVIEGQQFIAAEHGVGFYVIPIYKHFKLFEVNETATWMKKSLTTNAVTGTKTVQRSTPGGTVYLSVQPSRNIEDAIKIPNPQKIAICNKPVQVDDNLGDWVVTKSDTVLGVTLLELKEINA